MNRRKLTITRAATAQEARAPRVRIGCGCGCALLLLLLADLILRAFIHLFTLCIR